MSFFLLYAAVSEILLLTDTNRRMMQDICNMFLGFAGVRVIVFMIRKSLDV